MIRASVSLGNQPSIPLGDYLEQARNHPEAQWAIRLELTRNGKRWENAVIAYLEWQPDTNTFLLVGIER